ncbi:MAG: FesM [Anaerolineae bacterium]|nr:FesM [Anaerolineae bacterium]
MTTPLYRPPMLVDALRIPLIGRVLRTKRGRLALQIPLFLIAALLVYDGLTGDQIASRNLATVSAWVQYRGLVALALLLAGNLFCMGCPFTLPRTLARRLSIRGRRFPKFLRNKWLAIGGLFLFFWLYEWLDLWSSPWLTAWLIVSYFVASFVLEAVFTESAFCKYVCPLGTFNFVYSTTSPLQISARDHNVCRTCVGKECVNGSYAPQAVILIDEIKDGQPIKQHTNGPDGVLGCGTELFVPQIKSNMDCTMCLDCVRACPHDNVALAVRNPLREILDLSAWVKRWDVSFLLVALAFMGLINAFGMIPPVYALMNEFTRLTGISDPAVQTFVLFFTTMLVVPAMLSIGAAWLSSRLGGAKKEGALKATFSAFAPAFVPIGLGVWASHYAFHFLTGALTIVPVFQNFVLDHGITLLGTPNWSLAAVLPTEIVSVLEIVLLIGGYLVSAIVARRIAGKLYSRASSAQLAWLPYALLMLAMILFAAWVMSQPMEMRAVGSIG